MLFRISAFRKTNLFEESTIAYVHLHSKLACGVYPDLDAKFTLSAVATLLRRSGLTDALVALVLRHLLCLFSVRNTSVHLQYRWVSTFWTYGSKASRQSFSRTLRSQKTLFFQWVQTLGTLR